MSTGSLIRRTRQAEGLTQAALARRLGITQPSVARLEAAGDEVTVATLQRALNAMGRALELTVVQQKSSIDETLLHSTLQLTPEQRIQHFKQWYDGMQQFRHDIIESRARRAA